MAPLQARSLPHSYTQLQGHTKHTEENRIRCKTHKQIKIQDVKHSGYLGLRGLRGLATPRTLPALLLLDTLGGV